MLKIYIHWHKCSTKYWGIITIRAPSELTIWLQFHDSVSDATGCVVTMLIVDKRQPAGRFFYLPLAVAVAPSWRGVGKFELVLTGWRGYSGWLQHGSCLWSSSSKLLTRFRRQWAFPWDTVSLSALLQQLESSWLLKALHTSQINPADNFAETGCNVKLVRWDKSSTTWWGWWKQ